MQCSGVEAQLVAAQIKLESAVREKNEGKDFRIYIYVFLCQSKTEHLQQSLSGSPD